MKKYIKSNSEDTKYIGGKLYDLPEEYHDFGDDADELRMERSETQDEYFLQFADHYLIYCPDYKNNKFELHPTDEGLNYIAETMPIKDGVDLVAYPDHLELIAYYSGRETIAYLYPISDSKFDELCEILENSDFDESTTIDSEIAQSAWGGASVEDVLRSWR